MKKLTALLVILFPVVTGAQNVSYFNLIDAGTNTIVGQLNDGDTININSIPDIGIQAITNPNSVGSVVFNLSGPSSHTQTESVAPYALFGDNSGVYTAWGSPVIGQYNLTATAYSQSSGNGTPGTPLSISFHVLSGSGNPANQGVTDNVYVSGELKKWHRLTLTFDGVNTCENAAVNPFTEYRLMVTFTKGNKGYVVPGFYAADGNAANTSATCGNKWRVYFTPDETGVWNYAVSYRTGSNIAINDNLQAGSAVTPLDGVTGSITVSSTDKTGNDFRAKGMLRYVGEHYLQFAETGEYYLKGGADSPENFLGYDEFDQTSDHGGTSTPGLTNGLHHYGPHVQDWHTGDPTWKNGKGKGIIGALNYLASQGGNSVYFLTYNIDGGDGRDTWMWSSYNERYRFDVSKLAQWEIVFSHMDSLGIQMHVITQETENDHLLGGNGQLNNIRKLYYRELIARFSHHLAIQWNLGEENTNSNAEKASFAEFIRNWDPYDHPINVHTQYGNANSFYSGILNNSAYRQYFEATSIQGDATDYNSWAIDLRDASTASGKKWIIYGDEQGPAVDPSGSNFNTLRREALWGNLMGGGGGVEWYFGYQNTFGDVQSEDWSVVEPLWQQTKYALDFFQEYLPFSEMEPANNLLSAQSGDYCFAKAGDVYAVYLKYGGGGGAINLNINMQGVYTVKWYNPRSGGALQNGSVTTIQVTYSGNYSLGSPPAGGNNDWAVLVTSNSFTNMNSTITHTDVTCHGANDGTIDLTVTGGIPPHSYNWSNGATTSSLQGLSAGTYQVTVMDDNGNSITNSVTISEPQSLNISGNVSDESPAGNDGQILVTISGGTSPYAYHWSNGASTKNINALNAGSYGITVTDDNGCAKSKSFTISSSPMSSTMQNIDVTCFSDDDGSASITVSGGMPPYSYSWSNGATTASVSDLSAGIYSVTVQDNAGNSFTRSVEISEPDEINISGNISASSAEDALDGEVALAVTGGTPPYNYSWSNGGIGENITGLSSDDYVVTVTDANGCSKTATFSVAVDGPTSMLNNAGGMEQINIFPNPVVDELSVKVDLNDNVEIKLQLLDKLGRLIFTKNLGTTSSLNKQVDFSGLAAGLYLVCVFIGDRKIVRKVVKQ